MPGIVRVKKQKQSSQIADIEIPVDTAVAQLIRSFMRYCGNVRLRITASTQEALETHLVK